MERKTLNILAEINKASGGGFELTSADKDFARRVQLCRRTSADENGIADDALTHISPLLTMPEMLQWLSAMQQGIEIGWKTHEATMRAAADLMVPGSSEGQWLRDKRPRTHLDIIEDHASMMKRSF